MDDQNTKKWTTGVASLRSRRFLSGAFATLMSVLVIAAVIGANLVVSMLGIRSDLTAVKKYSLTEETKNFLGTLEDKITIYYLTKENNSISWLETFFEEYQKESKNITVKTVDMLINPNFASKYTSEDVIQHSLIVVNETNGRSRYVSYKDLLIFEYSFDANFQYKESVKGVDIEGQIDSAIRYVTTGEQTNFYALAGHGEIALGSEAQTYLHRSNIFYTELELLKAGKIPEDCDVLYIALPQTDYTDEEIAAIRDYAAAGGDILVLGAYQANLKNFNSLLGDYGIEMAEGVIFEGDDKYHAASALYSIFPKVIDHTITSKLPSNRYLMMPMAYSVVVKKNLPESLKAASLLTTSDASYLKVADENGALVQSKTDEDVAGPFRVGVYVKNEATGAEMTIFGGPTMFVDDFFKMESYANAELFANSVSFMADAGEVFSVRKILFDSDETLVITAAQALTVGIVCILLIPILLIVSGIVIVIMRRRR